MRENKIVARLKTLVDDAGGYIRKVEFAQVRGAPDQLVCVPLVPHLAEPFWVEAKSTVGVVAGHQKREHARLEKIGMRVFVLSSYQEVDMLFANAPDELRSIKKKGKKRARVSTKTIPGVDTRCDN